MAVAAAERIETEAYAHSLSTLRRLGGFAVIQSRSQEQIDTEELAYLDFETAVTEMLKTDQEFRSELDVDNQRSHQVIAGLTRSTDGTPMVAVLDDEGTQALYDTSPVLWVRSAIAVGSERRPSDVTDKELVARLADGGLDDWAPPLTHSLTNYLQDQGFFIFN